MYMFIYINSFWILWPVFNVAKDQICFEMYNQTSNFNMMLDKGGGGENI